MVHVTEKYDYVGRLLAPGQQATDYDLDEEDGTASEAAAGDKKAN